MLLFYLRTFLRWVGRLVFPPPPSLFARVDINAKCPVCGHKRGRLGCVVADKFVGCSHTCAVCGARWMEKTVARVDAMNVSSSRGFNYTRDAEGRLFRPPAPGTVGTSTGDTMRKTDA